MTNPNELGIEAVNKWLDELEELEKEKQLSLEAGDTAEYDIEQILKMEVSKE